jgi:hypothetical protein
MDAIKVEAESDKDKYTYMSSGNQLMDIKEEEHPELQLGPLLYSKVKVSTVNFLR